MDRNTIFAIILSIVVIVVGTTVQTVFFPADYTTQEKTQVVEEQVSSSIFESTTDEIEEVIKVTNTAPFEVKTASMTVTFDPYGASVSSIKMNDHLYTDGENVEVLLKHGDKGNAFLLYPSNDISNPIDAPFNYEIENRGDLTLVKFSQRFVQESNEYEIVKKYALSNNDEYLFQLAVTFNAIKGEIPFSSYTIGVEPQVGPEFENLSGNYDYRRMYYLAEGKNKSNVVSVNKTGVYNLDKNVDWVALASKYFTIISIPAAKESTDVLFLQDNSEKQENSYFLTRSNLSSSLTDVYSFYTGPKLSQNLNKYIIANDNTFKLSELKLAKVMDSSSWLGWLETVLKWVLQLIYKVVPNYGVAIIILTLLIKLMLHPISKKGLDSTAKMSALNPKIEELKAKYADDPNALNAAMAKVYKEEGINPMGSCLPMLIQFPVFIALYGLLNNHFELRGAMFIPGWIPDLSIPDTVYRLGFNIPFLGNQVHLLPIIYTASMIFSMKITQTTTTQSSTNGMMSFMTYGMPIIFFFVLYNAPSGLLVYWSVTNAVSIIQQVFTNKKKKHQYELEQKEKEESNSIKFKRKKR